MARHAVAAGDRRRIVVWGRSAAGRAYEVGAIEEAVAHLELALARWDPEDGEQLRAELLLDCGRLRARLSRGDERAVELLERAREAALALGEAATAAVALALLADARFEFGQREQALADWDEALTELREVGPSEAIPQALAGHARGLGLQSDFDASRRVADEGLALLPEAANADQARVRVSLLTTRGMIDMLEYRLDEARPRLLEAARLAVEHSDDLGAARAHHILGSNMFAVPPHESVSHFTRAAELVRRHGLRGLEAWYVTLQAWSMVHAGDWSTAERLLDEAESLIDEGERAAWTRLIAESVRADRLIGLGELDAAANALAHVVERGTEMGSANFRDTGIAARAGVACLAGDIEAAHADVRRFADELLTGSPGAFAVLELNNWLLVVEILAAAGDLTRAAAVAAVIREEVGGVTWADYTDSVAECANVPPDDAAARIETAIAAVEATGYLLEAARMRVAASVVLATRPSGRAAAAGLARAAHERFIELGSPAWCRRLEEMLRRLGEPLTRRGGGAGGLTRRELEVLGALAEGLTNRGIAERLVISESTAIRHVANIYGKLGANNRAAAVRIATERGLLAGRADMATAPDGAAEDT
jgi:DNA-binding NarL/FixJ family response regulator